MYHNPSTSKAYKGKKVQGESSKPSKKKKIVSPYNSNDYLTVESSAPPPKAPRSSAPSKLYEVIFDLLSLNIIIVDDDTRVENWVKYYK